MFTKINQGLRSIKFRSKFSPKDNEQCHCYLRKKDVQLCTHLHFKQCIIRRKNDNSSRQLSLRPAIFITQVGDIVCNQNNVSDLNIHIYNCYNSSIYCRLQV